jgi:hypothetical protein
MALLQKMAIIITITFFNGFVVKKVLMSSPSSMVVVL